MRTFVAITTPPAGPVPAFLDDCRRRLDSVRPDVKWVAAQHRHITLRFLGDVPPEEIDAVRDAVLRAAAGQRRFAAALTGWGAFPSVARPQTIWASAHAEGGALEALESALTDELKTVGLPPESKAFHPHITLGRVRSQRGVDALTRVLKSPSPPTAGTDFAVDAITLFESVLSPAGPRYTVLLEAPLGADRKSV